MKNKGGMKGAEVEGSTSRMQPVSDNQRNDEEGREWRWRMGWGGRWRVREERAKGESVTGVAVLMTEPPSEGT